MTEENAAQEPRAGDGPAQPNPELDTDPAHARQNPESARVDPHTPYPDMPPARPETAIRVGVPVKPQPVDTEDSGPAAEASAPEQ